MHSCKQWTEEKLLQDKQEEKAHTLFYQLTELKQFAGGWLKDSHKIYLYTWAFPPSLILMAKASFSSEQFILMAEK